MCDQRKPRLSFAAFSLFELLVVVAIISVLVSLLLPAVGVVRSSARATICMMHIRQLQLAVEVYAQNCDGQLVLTKWGFNPVQAQWETLLANQVPDILDGDSVIAQSASGTFTKKSIVRGCPEFRAAFNPALASVLQYTSGYGFNERPLIQPKTWQTFYKYNYLWSGSGSEMTLAQVPDKSGRISFGDADDYWLNGMGAGQNWGTVNQPREWQASGNRTSGFIKIGMEAYRRHRGKAMYTFFDGHAENLDSPHALDRFLDPANQMGANLQ